VLEQSQTHPLGVATVIHHAGSEQPPRWHGPRV
jgi:hypothetical protein